MSEDDYNELKEEDRLDALYGVYWEKIKTTIMEVIE